MRLKNEIESMEFPNELSERSKKGIYQAHTEETKGNKFFKSMPMKFGSIAGAVVLAFSILMFTNTGFANSVKGFFEDITNWSGTVTGTVYENATNEITADVGEKVIQSDKVSFPLSITLKEPDKAPYNTIEALTIGDFQVFQSGKPVNNEQIAFERGPMAEFEFMIKDEDKLLILEDKKFKTNLVINNLSTSANETYTLIINSFFIQSKGDAPLEVKGEWEVNLK